MITQKEEAQLRADLEAMTWLACVLQTVLYQTGMSSTEAGIRIKTVLRLGRPPDCVVEEVKILSHIIVDPSQRG